MTSIRLKIEESWYASMDCKVQKSGPWVCFYGGHSTGYKLGNHPKNIEPCAHRARTVRAPCDNAPLLPVFYFSAGVNISPGPACRWMHTQHDRFVFDNTYLSFAFTDTGSKGKILSSRNRAPSGPALFCFARIAQRKGV